MQSRIITEVVDVIEKYEHVVGSNYSLKFLALEESIEEAFTTSLLSVFHSGILRGLSELFYWLILARNV